MLPLLAVLALSAFLSDPHISFSVDSGFYDHSFMLAINGGAGTQIYYTLDGSMPTMQDIPYQKGRPIPLTDATVHENVYSMRTDVSTAFYADPEADATVPVYQSPQYPIDKCNLVRAASFDEAGNCLDSIVGVYFIGFSDKKGYDGLYTASIIADPEDLFGSERGIYVAGDSFQGPTEDPWWLWDANYLADGRPSERKAVLTIFDEKQKVLLSENCGIRINGEYSRAFLPKNIGCFARKEYGGRNEFSYDLFEENVYPHKIAITGGGNDNVFKLKDYIAQTLEAEMNFATLKMIPCVLFLNGEYWGVCWLTEFYNADYINDRFHVQEDNVILIKNYELKEGFEEDYLAFEEMRYYIQTNDMTVPECWWKACALIDMDSYIDYYAAQIYLARCTDWPGHNEALWRTRDPENSDYGDCRWRWMLFDLNSDGMTENLAQTDTLGDILEGDAVFASLFKNEEFRQRFLNRMQYLGEKVYAPENLDPLLADCVRLMREPLQMSNMRFYMDTRDAEFALYVEDKRRFFEKRYDVILKSLAAHSKGN